MSNVNIKQVEGGEITSLADTDGVEIDTGTTSVWIQIVNLVQQILKRINGLTSKASLADADEFVVADSAASWTAKKVANSTLRTYIQNRVNRTLLSGLGLIWNSATSISVQPGVCLAQNGDFINSSSTLTASGLSLSASTWYHIYIYLSAGTPTIEVVTAAPVAWEGTAYSKTADTSRRYVGSIKTDGSGNVINFVHNPITNQVLYRKHQVTAAPFLVLSSGTATVATAVSCSGIVPATVAAALLLVVNTGDQVLRLSEDNGVGSTQVSWVVGSTERLSTTQLLDASFQFWYAFGAVLGSGGGFAYVTGYWFNR